MADPELTQQYTDILRAGFLSAAGASVHPDLDASAEASVVGSAEMLAEQLEASVLDAPWMRSQILDVVGEWLQQAGELNLNDLRESLEPVFGPSRALTIARSETAGAFNGAMAAGLRAHGWGHVVWIAAPDACDECQDMDGTVMSISDYEANSTVHPNCSCTAEPYDEEDGGEAGDEDEADAEGEE